jgi:hypothetical protein
VRTTFGFEDLQTSLEAPGLPIPDQKRRRKTDDHSGKHDGPDAHAISPGRLTFNVDERTGCRNQVQQKRSEPLEQRRARYGKL